MTKKIKTLSILSILGAGVLAFYLIFVKSVQATPTQNFTGEVIKYYNAYLPDYLVTEITKSVTKWTDDRNVSLLTILAIMAQESHFEPLETGKDDDIGLMQLTEIALLELERKYGVSIDRTKLYAVDDNIKWGTLYYRYCAMRANNNRFEAISRYNKTTDWHLAEDYANEVLVKRAEIVQIYEKYD